MAKILVTGATGFVGKRLITYLLEQGHEVYALCRIKGARAAHEEKANLHYLWGDLKEPGPIALPEDLDAAYYLVHSMTRIVQNLVDTEIEIAHRFIDWIKKTKVKQIIYLGGIINDEKNLSPHLRSRLLVEKALKDGGIPTTILRASVIIGSGSASFEIIRELTEKLPLMITPKWINTLCQPIAIRDVIFYLSSVLLNPSCYDRTFDIGGPDVFTFKQLMLEYAHFRHLKRWIIVTPVLSTRISSYWLVLVTSVRFSLCLYLIESMKIPSVCKNDAIKKILPHTCLTYRQALEIAFQKISRNEILSTWRDSWGIDEADLQIPQEGCLRKTDRVPLRDPFEAVVERIWRIGGNTGWYAYNWTWKTRGLIDHLAGGAGLHRGRRHPSDLQMGDAVDFWRVICADRKTGHLVLFASMYVPAGELWLEFKIEDNHLVQTTTFRPKGILARFYWHLAKPIHFFIFRKMARTIAGYNYTEK